MNRRLFAFVPGLAMVVALGVYMGPSLNVSAATLSTLDLKVLLIGGPGGTCAAPTDATTAAWVSTLTSEGVPFECVLAAGTSPSETITLPALSSGTTGYYNGVVLADSPTAFTAGQLSALDVYEVASGVRQLDGYVSPTSTLGETDVSAVALDGTTGTLTAAGLAAFPELAGPVPFDTGTFGYPASASSASFTPYICAASPCSASNVLGGVYLHPSTDAQAGVSEMVLNFNYNASQLQWLLLGPSLIAWVTKDTYLGLYRNYIEMDIDDVFTPDDVWCVTTTANCTADSIDYADIDAVRMTAPDVAYAAAWEASSNFRFDMLYNGGGSVDEQSSNGGTDPLLAAFQATDPATSKPYADDFGWLSHTYDTPYLDVGCATQNYIEAEINENTSWAAESGSGGTGGLGLTESTDTSNALGYENPDVFVPGNHSGFADLVPGNPATVDPPDLDDTTTVNTGGALAAGEYAYAVTDQFVASTGTPTGSNAQSQADVTDVTVTTGQEVQLNWESICHAAQYNIYRAPAPGGVVTSGTWDYLGDVSTPFDATLPDNSSGNPTSTTDVTNGGELEQDYLDTGAAGTSVADTVADPTAEDALETPWEQNPYFIPALEAVGITAVGDDASKPYPYPDTDAFGIGASYTCATPSTNCYAAGQTFVEGTTAQVVPRHPNDIYYDAATENEEVSEFDYLNDTAPYRTYSFANIVSYEDSSLLHEMLGNDPRPNYVHQTNIVGNPGDGAGVSDGTLYSVLTPLLAEYHSYVNSRAPYEQLTMGAIGTTLGEQTAWAGTTTPVVAAGAISTVTASETGGVITLDNTGTTAATAPLTAPTGTIVGTTGTTAFGQAYGGTLSAWVPLAAGATATFSTPGAAPAFTSAATETASVSTAFTFTVTTSGDPAATLTETGTLPTGVTFTPGTGTDAGTATIAGTPAAGTEGSYPITITASSTVGTTTQTATQAFTLIVDQGPAITSAALATATVGSTFNFGVTTSGSPAPALTESGTLPAAITFLDNGNGTATLSGIPGTGTQGVYPITITATNTAGTIAQSFTLTVVPASAPPGGGGSPGGGSPPGGVLGATTDGAYTALTPLRLLDTRETGKTLGPNSSLSLPVVTTADGVPSTATAVALNVTVTNTTSAGYLSAFPTGSAQPAVSNLNWTKGETVANSVIVPIGSANSDIFYNYAGKANVVVDLEGYFAPASGNAGAYVPLTPDRITDTRSGSGAPNAGDTLGAGSTLNVQVTGEDGIPAGATGAILNVTVTDTNSAGYLTAYPQGATRPTASNLDWNAGATVANRVLVPLGSTGMITLYNYTGSADVIVDVDGYFTNGTATLPSNASLYTTITPTRLVDTRVSGGTLGAGATYTAQIAGSGGISSTATAAVLNITATDTTAASFFTAFPGGIMPTASDVNWGPGQTIPNLTVATLSSLGAITIYNRAGRADLVIDAFGYFSPVGTS
jgi:hypothetical protein